MTFAAPWRPLKKDLSSSSTIRDSCAFPTLSNCALTMKMSPVSAMKEMLGCLDKWPWPGVCLYVRRPLVSTAIIINARLKPLGLAFSQLVGRSLVFQEDKSMIAKKVPATAALSYCSSDDRAHLQQLSGNQHQWSDQKQKINK